MGLEERVRALQARLAAEPPRPNVVDRVRTAFTEGVKDVLPTGARPGSSISRLSGAVVDPEYDSKVQNIGLNALGVVKPVGGNWLGTQNPGTLARALMPAAMPMNVIEPVGLDTIRWLKNHNIPRSKAGILEEVTRQPGLNKSTIPELRISEFNQLPAATPMTGNLALRYELAGAPQFEKDVYHYDLTGGLQLPDIIAWKKRQLARGEHGFGNATPEQIFSYGRVRASPVSKLRDENSWVSPYPDVDVLPPEAADQLARGKHVLYQNAIEGTEAPRLINPTIERLLSNPELLSKYNFSVAAPVNSDLHRGSVVFKADGGPVTMNPHLEAQGRRYRREPFEESYAPSVPSDTFQIPKDVQLERDRKRLELLKAEQAAGDKNPRLPKEIANTEKKLAAGDPWLRTPIGYAEGGLAERIHALHLRAGGLVPKTNAFKAAPPSKLTNQYKVKV